jgi:hypothetical protein
MLCVRLWLDSRSETPTNNGFADAASFEEQPPILEVEKRSESGRRAKVNRERCKRWQTKKQCSSFPFFRRAL